MKQNFAFRKHGISAFDMSSNWGMTSWGEPNIKLFQENIRILCTLIWNYIFKVKQQQQQHEVLLPKNPKVLDRLGKS